MDNMSSINNVNKRKRTGRNGRMNIVDWLLIVVALAALVTFVYFAFFSELDLFGSKDEGAAVEYTLRVEDVNAQLFGLSISEKSGDISADFLRTGDKLYDCKTGTQIGRVVSVGYEQSTRSTGEVDENGNVIYADYPGYVDLIIRVSGNGVGKDASYSINGYELKIGSGVEFRSEGYTANGKIISVSGKELEESGK